MQREQEQQRTLAILTGILLALFLAGLAWGLTLT